MFHLCFWFLNLALCHTTVKVMSKVISCYCSCGFHFPLHASVDQLLIIPNQHVRPRSNTKGTPRETSKAACRADKDRGEIRGMFWQFSSITQKWTGNCGENLVDWTVIHKGSVHRHVHIAKLSWHDSRIFITYRSPSEVGCAKIAHPSSRLIDLFKFMTAQTLRVPIPKYSKL